VDALPHGLDSFVCSGVAIVVATRDQNLRPEVGRGWGPAVDGTAVTLCVTSPAGFGTRANLESNGAIAVTCSLPTTYRSVQMKGAAVEVRDVSAADEARVDAHLDAFMTQVRQVGIPAEYRLAAIVGPLFTVTFAVAELFDQTPGPGAGGRL